LCSYGHTRAIVTGGDANSLRQHFQSDAEPNAGGRKTSTQCQTRSRVEASGTLSGDDGHTADESAVDESVKIDNESRSVSDDKLREQFAGVIRGQADRGRRVEAGVWTQQRVLRDGPHRRRTPAGCQLS